MLPIPNGTAAVISPDGMYRYLLTRRVGSATRRVTFIGLNPSTADSVQDDPTIRRCKGFARDWGCGELWVVNLFALRSPNPSALLNCVDPIGPDNDGWLGAAVEGADLVVAAWGNDGRLRSRGNSVGARFGGRLHTLGLTKLGQPKHPLYVRAGAILERLPRG